LEVANALASIYKKEVTPEISGKFRPGEVRHIVADISRIKELGFNPEYSFLEGLREYVEWIQTQGNIKDYFSQVQLNLAKEQVVRDCR